MVQKLRTENDNERALNWSENNKPEFAAGELPLHERVKLGSSEVGSRETRLEKRGKFVAVEFIERN